MTKLITPRLKIESANNFYQSFANNTFFVGVLLANTPGDSSVVNSENNFRRLVNDQLIFAKQIKNTDRKLMIDFNDWESGTVYTQYDDLTVNLSDKDYFVCVADNNNDDHHVFKCISNNYGAESTSSPTYDGSIMYYTNDGYIWRYMYTIGISDYFNFKTSNRIPLTEFSQANTSSGIENIIVNNREENSDYFNVANVSVISKTGKVLTVACTALSTTNDYYNHMNAYFTENGKASELIEISDYVVSGATKQIYLSTDLASINAVSSNTTLSLVPRVNIYGDGTGAKALANIEGTSIVSIDMLSPGTGYTVAYANVASPIFGTVEAASLRPIIPPKGGHGSDLRMELRADDVMVMSILEDTDLATLPTNNTFSKIALLKNPEFNTSNVDAFDNRLALDLDGPSPFNVGEIVYQVDSTNRVAQGVVHENSGNTVYLVEYKSYFGDFSNAYSILGETTGLSADINTITASPYIYDSADVLAVISFNPVERSANTVQQVKIVIDF